MLFLRRSPLSGLTRVFTQNSNAIQRRLFTASSRCLRSSSSTNAVVFHPSSWQRRATTSKTSRRGISSEFTPPPSAQSVLRDALHADRHDKWGWVIYRCTYDDDEAWSRFKQIVNDRSREELTESDAPQLLDSLEWTFVEDRQTLDGATKAELRPRFLAWAKDACKLEQPRDHDVGNYLLNIPRYNYFIYIDEPALRSVVHGHPDDYWEEGWVDLVRACWKPQGPPVYTEEQIAALEALGGVHDEDDVHDPIEGCTEEDVGWMRMVSGMMNSEFYEAIYGVNSWYVFYQRPPEIVSW